MSHHEQNQNQGKLEIYIALLASLDAKKSRRVTQTGYSLLLHTGIIVSLFQINTAEFNGKYSALIEDNLKFIFYFLLIAGFLLSLSWIFRQYKYYQDKHVREKSIQDYLNKIIGDKDSVDSSPQVNQDASKQKSEGKCCQKNLANLK